MSTSCIHIRLSVLWSVIVTYACIMNTPTANAALHIGTLLSTCVDACERACHEIRAVERKRQESVNNSINNNANGRNDDDALLLQVEWKDANEPRCALTIADRAAQLVICGSLRAEWGKSLQIIGEEDGNEQVELLLQETEFEPLRRNLFEDDMDHESSPKLDGDNVIVYVDPLDGTREFVEGRLESCQSLIGIAIEGRAVAGVIGIPFPAGDLSKEPTIIYGLSEIGSGVRGEPLTRGPFPLDRNIDGVKYPRPHIATGDKDTPIMNACRKVATKRFGGSNVIYGGAGNKILAAALGEVACCIGSKYGGPWDLCAPEAILTAMGGRLTDLSGRDIAVYGHQDAPSRFTERGYVATPSSSVINHDALTAAISQDPVIQDYLEDVSI